MSGISRECELYAPVKRWLVERGYVIYVEQFDADIVAMKDEKVTAVELKRGFTEQLVRQLCHRATWADYVIAAVPAMAGKPVRRNFRLGLLRSSGFGCLLVIGEKVKQIAKPRPQPWLWHKRHAYRIKALAGRLPAQEHEIAGLPSCRELKENRRLARESLG